MGAEAVIGCAFEGCTKPIKTRGHCSGHAAQLDRGQALKPLRPKWAAGSENAVFVHGEGPRSAGFSPEYRAWNAMRTRCSNPKADSFKHYGGRGIRVCDRWASFPVFLADMGRRPSSRHSIDRRDPNGNYEPDNCRWATPIEQRRNQSRVKLYDYNGSRLILTEISARCGVSVATLWDRLRRGQTITEAASPGRQKPGPKP